MNECYRDFPKEIKDVVSKEDIYTLEQFIRDIQSVTGSEVDGIVGPETLGNTVTISASVNSTNPVVKFVQKRLAALGYTEVGDADGIAGPLFDEAVKAFQHNNQCVEDGEITENNKTWKKLLGGVI
jgi:peptidoglycan hydrolase-like protein with peptidoglycan-binding domain